MKLHELGTVILVVLSLMGLFVVGATVTGQSKELCDGMGGTYTPANANVADVCPGGSWRNLLREKK
jgi:hypothetical protein